MGGTREKFGRPQGRAIASGVRKKVDRQAYSGVLGLVPRMAASTRICPYCWVSAGAAPSSGMLVRRLPRVE